MQEKKQVNETQSETQNKKQRRKRIRLTNFETDLHIRLEGKYLEKIKERAKELSITNALMARSIIQEYFDNLDNDNRNVEINKKDSEREN